MKLNSFNWHSLKTRVTLFSLLIFLSGIWSLSFYASRFLRQDMEQLLSQQQLATASIVASTLDHELKIRLEALKEAAKLSAPSMQKGTQAMQAFLEQRQNLQILFNGTVAAHARDETIIADYPAHPEPRVLNYMDTEVIKAALTESKSTIGRPTLDKTMKQPAFSMATPIFDAQGKVIGALGGVINLGPSSFFDRVTENRYGKAGGYILIAPQFRLVITSTDKTSVLEELPAQGSNSELDRLLMGAEDSTVLISPHGVEILASVKRIPVAGWLIMAELPTTEAFAPIQKMQMRILLASILLTFLAGGLSWWILRRELAPLLLTANDLEAMSDGSQPMHPLTINRQDEIGKVIGSFNRFLETIEQHETEREEALNRLQKIANRVPGVIYQLRLRPDGSSCIPFASDAVREMFRIPQKEVGEDWLNGARCHHPEDSAGISETLQKSAHDLSKWCHEFRVKFDDGTVRWLLGNAMPEREADGSTLFHGFISDITESKQAEHKLQLAASVFSHAREAIVITAADGTIIDVNDAFVRITGYEREEAIGHNPHILSSGIHDKEFYVALWSDLIEKGHWYGEIWNRRKNGEIYVEMQTISAVRDERGKLLHYVALFSDITQIKEHERQLEHIAHYDVLTTLPNRVLFADRIQQAMSQSIRRRQLLAVAYIDLDGFKVVNDRHGHDIGDQLLIVLANRMKQTLREGDTLARLGGDEFVAVLIDLGDNEACVPMLSRLLDAAAQPVLIEGITLQVSASLGVTFYPQTEEVDADQLLRQADQSMYQAKLAGKNRYHIFDSEQDRCARGHHESLTRIRRGLIEREFVLYYQPVVNMRTGAIVGAEALIRWQHPERGLLAPEAFLSVIEEHPLGIEIGEWVIDNALTQIEAWHAAGLNIPISVNVGSRQLQQTNFVERLRLMLTAHQGVRPNDLQMEVLETSALKDLAHISRVINECRDIGVMFALDDFGTGYSSLTYLKRLPVAVLKIDQSFVRGMLDDPDDLTILSGVISLAGAFRRQAIADGVETIAHGEMLLQLGCELAQGYGIAYPMPASEIPAWIESWSPDPVWSNTYPVIHDDLPLLFAGVEHRGWLAACEAVIKGEREALPVLNHSCHLGQWLDTEGQARYGSYLEFLGIEPLHLQVHLLAAELLKLCALGRNQDALARLIELHEASNSLLAQLKLLMIKVRL